MERLTKRYTYNGKPEISVDSKINGISCSNFCTSCGKADCDDIRKSLFKLAEYEYLEEQRKLWKLPCAVEDVVYQHMIVGVDKDKRKAVYEVFKAKVFKFSLDSYGLYFWTETEDEKKYQNEVPLSAFGKTVFLTKEEAEAALKKYEHQSNNKQTPKKH